MLLAVVVSVASCGGGGDGGGGDGGAADTQAPTVAITGPADFASGIAGMLTFSANATDNAGVASVEFQVDGIAAGVPQTTAPYSVSVNTNDHASGQHVLRVRASDAAGNQSAWDSATVSFGSRTQPAGFTRNTAFITNSNLSAATAFAQAPDGRIFVAQQGGAMRVVTSGGTLLGPPFLALVVDSTGERGLLGVAFHPNFAANNLVYAYYTVPGSPPHNRISRFTANGDVVVLNSEQILVDLPNLSATNHNGGAIHFGTDGKLYVGVGENAVPDNSQSLLNPLGKLLRFNDDGTIPSDNPFLSTTSGLSQAIWALGLRNPFTFAVQPGTGRIHINDVGQNTWEEINLGVAGANYGWPTTEGPTAVAGITGPLLAYKHSATNPPGSGPGGFFTGCAIAGGTFYPDTGPFPAAYRGNYFFADLCTNFVARLDLANGNAVYSFGAVTGGPVDMLVANDGALLVLTRNSIVRFSAP